MLNGGRIAVFMPAYNAARTLQPIYADIRKDIVDTIILGDDFSSDNTVNISRELVIELLLPTENRGYGANQKTCCLTALLLRISRWRNLRPHEVFR
jgi:glycosyltransferase involved in cell wall biosynthesis